VTAFQGSGPEAGEPSRVRVEVPVEVPVGADGQVEVQVPAAAGSGQVPVSVTVDVSGLVDAVQAGVQQAAAGNGSAAQGGSGGSGGDGSSGGGGGGPVRKVVKALPRVSRACSSSEKCVAPLLLRRQRLKPGAPAAGAQWGSEALASGK
jgi:hypothetical protein